MQKKSWCALAVFDPLPSVGISAWEIPAWNMGEITPGISGFGRRQD